MNGTRGRRQSVAFLESNTTGTGREFCAAVSRRGLRPVLLTRDPARYPYVAADRIDNVRLDTGDLAAVLAACSRLADDGLAGIVSSSEYFVAAAARAAARLGLPSPDGDAVARSRDKEAQRALLAAAGVPVPAHVAASDVEAALRAAAAVGYPAVLKPVSGSGSVGVRLCRTPAETRDWAARLLRRTEDERGAAVQSRILVEEAVDGPEFSVETFDRRVVAVVAKHIGPQPYFVETGHDVPAPVAPAVSGLLGETALRALAALGLGWGAAHTELRWSAAGPVVIEVNPRLAGGMIPVAVRAATGTDLVDAVIARAVGGELPTAAPTAGHAAVRFALAPGPGCVVRVDGEQAARSAPGVVAAQMRAVPGSRVRITHSFEDRLGCVVAVGANAGEAGRRAQDALCLIRVELEEQDMLEKGAGGR
ncbi:ATP-grasp domain-containing protein [Streptomyces noursei]|uniref:ATP-grasp domain-containing protein n=1 Tax=Streptomyces noursei TaxID=1971 RepID=UPI001673448A|nr:ATP-grasp domain-containing protein [Streptomyces noursei]MCZ1013285.1 ATP-grasp domain-containing protein [Streptomyces noursei]GGX53463.1 argininosuccinate lyase [Streptomyces noursei]